MYNKGVPSGPPGHFLFNQNDFVNFKWLPKSWWYFLNEHGEGFAVDFLRKIKPALSWSAQHYIKNYGRLVRVKRFPLEKICVTVAKQPCNLNNLHT